MDVDTDNFEDALVAFEEHLPSATFVALDLEMTGINGPSDTFVSKGDVPQVQYGKGRKVVNRPLNIVQVGLCLFEESAPGSFQCRPFNVFVFPRAVDERDADGKQIKDDPFVGMSSSSISFLVEHRMDFHRWLAKGVSYTAADVEEALLKAMPAEQSVASSSSFRGDKEKVTPNKPEDIELVESTMRQISDFVASGGEEMKLPDTNNFMALVFRQRIAEKWPTLDVEKRPHASRPNWHERWVVNLSDAGRMRKIQERRKHLLALIGFRRLWRLLRAAKKPVIVHNGFFDLMFSVAAFDKPLPPALEDFKALVHTAFPSIFDTKVLAECAELSGRLGSRSVLGELATSLNKKIRPPKGAAVASTAGTGEAKGNAGLAVGKDGGAAPEAETGAPLDADDEAALITIGESGEEIAHLTFSLPEGFDKYSSAADFHTAGFDAFETGRIFAYYRAVLGDERIEAFANRIFLMWSAFQLQVGEVSDRLMVDGIVRFLHHVDGNRVAGNRGLVELLKPLTQDGKRRCDFRWCGKDRLLLVVQGEDCKAGAEGREACEQVLDSVLQREAEVGGLQFTALQAHLEAMSAGAVPRGSGLMSPGNVGEGAQEPPYKRQRR